MALYKSQLNRLTCFTHLMLAANPSLIIWSAVCPSFLSCLKCNPRCYNFLRTALLRNVKQYHLRKQQTPSTPKPFLLAQFPLSSFPRNAHGRTQLPITFSSAIKLIKKLAISPRVYQLFPELTLFVRLCHRTDL